MNAKYSIVCEDLENGFVLIRDCNGSKSITNDAENVVKHIKDVLEKRNKGIDVSHLRIFYYDSSSSIDELERNENGEFTGFIIHSFYSKSDVIKCVNA